MRKTQEFNMDKEDYLNGDGTLKIRARCMNNTGVEKELKLNKTYDPIQDWFGHQWEILNEEGNCRMYDNSRFGIIWK